MLRLNPNVVRRVVAGVDWGFTNPGVIGVWAVDSDGRMYLVREVYRSQRKIGWWVDQAKAIRQDFRVEMFACDPAEPGFIAEFASAGLPVVKGFNDIALGLQAVMARLVPAGDGRPRLYVYEDANQDRDEVLVEAGKPASTAEEFDSYVWPKGQGGKAVKEVPVDDSNHGMDAMRYAVAYVDKLGPRPASKAAVPGRDHLSRYRG